MFKKDEEVVRHRYERGHGEICHAASIIFIYTKKGLAISTTEAMQRLQSCYRMNLRSDKYRTD